MREAERRCPFRSIYARTIFSASVICVKMLREGDRRAKALLLLAFLDIYLSKPMRVNSERTRGTRTDEENRRNKEVLKQGAESLERIYESTAEIQ